MERDEARVLALAGVFQAAALVHDIARHGRAERTALEASLRSVLTLDAPDAETAFGGPAGVALGLAELARQLRGPREMEVARYVVALLHLERRLRRQPPLLAAIRAGVERGARQAELFGLTHTNVIAGLAGTYEETAGRIRPRILVNGQAVHLTHPDNVHRIRALLLAGLRAVFLWRRLGGSRLQLLLGQRRLAAAARRLRERIDREAPTP
ncbi:high frequency lysogenization protein HflD [Inmirania thermothiophila]|uniref:High frequency lysogenization protein HflD homolog n=1 Tax=Inmirania thermothiophila TaxID=1750597 RepID=A0A3N1Y4S7_9GAMM|nr:high frequency lysogenization protein HflD [Inmirania thermothiophila]ROR32622.1 high frequency lysogenization protein [Inmirania thermothiophila]